MKITYLPFWLHVDRFPGTSLKFSQALCTTDTIPLVNMCIFAFNFLGTIVKSNIS